MMDDCWQVLADDLNQDFMRSIVSVFRQSRMFVGKFVSWQTFSP